MIPFLSSRYAFSSSYKQRDRAIRAVVAIALSLVVVNVVISIMDFLQNGRFEDIRDVRSFDIVVEGKHKEELSQYFPKSILFEYGEGEALTSDGAYNVRYISSDYDGGLNILYGDSSSLMVPYSLFRSSSGKITTEREERGKDRTIKTILLFRNYVLVSSPLGIHLNFHAFLHTVGLERKMRKRW